MTNLKFLLVKRGITQREFAEMLGLPDSNISRYVAHDRIPRATMAVKMANLLGVQVEDLFDEKGWREYQ